MKASSDSSEPPSSPDASAQIRETCNKNMAVTLLATTITEQLPLSAADLLHLIRVQFPLRFVIAFHVFFSSNPSRDGKGAYQFIPVTMLPRKADEGSGNVSCLLFSVFVREFDLHEIPPGIGIEEKLVVI